MLKKYQIAVKFALNIYGGKVKYKSITLQYLDIFTKSD